MQHDSRIAGQSVAWSQTSRNLSPFCREFGQAPRRGRLTIGVYPMTSSLRLELACSTSPP
jgi:hypothetical protein